VRDDSTLPECNDGDDDFVLDVEDLSANDRTSDSEGSSDDVWDYNNLRDDLRDADIQAFFDNVLQALHAVLNEISSTLQILAVYWTSFQPLQIHELLPPLPCPRRTSY
jgi:hypothetical protein